MPASQTVTWQISYTLAEGRNTLSFTQKDSGGNHSIPIVKTVVYDEILPLEVYPVADGRGSGTSVTLSWTDYDEVSDLGYYKIYISDSPFTAVPAPSVTLLATTSRGVKTYTATVLVSGRTYYFAVIGVDNKNNENLAVSSAVSAAPVDALAPEDVTNLKVTECTAKSLSVSWTPSKNSVGDLHHQSIHINGDVEGIELEPDVASYTGIEPASQELKVIDSVMVRVYDDKGNKSAGRVIQKIPLLVPGPSSIQTQSKIGGLVLSWTGQGEYAASYNIYAEQNPISGTVVGLTPKVSTKNLPSPSPGTAATTATLTGLSNETAYYLTVTTVNSIGFEDKTRFIVVHETPHSNQQGPKVTSFKANEVNLIDGLVLKYPTIFALTATDETGIDRVVFTVDGKPLTTDTAAPYQSGTWNIIQEQDGDHIAGATLYDRMGNITEVSYAVAIQCAAPPAPVITAPPSGVVAAAVQTISGTAQAGAQINLLLNNALQTLSPSVFAGSDGRFSFSFTLPEGENSIRLSAKNRKNTGPLSNALVLTYDTASPAPPRNLSAIPKAGGQVQLSWDPPPGESIKGYNIYRSIDNAHSGPLKKVNAALVKGTSYLDLAVAGDGLPCEYRVQAVDQADLPSSYSDGFTVIPDATGPAIVGVAFNHRGVSDMSKKPYIMGRGELEVTITVSEELSAAPFVNVIASGGKAIGISLTKVNQTQYFGSFEINADTPGGPAIITFSGRDMAGNRGTAVASKDKSLVIDSQGPQMVSLTLDPVPPINNDPQATVSFTFTLDGEPVEDPEVFYVINNGNGNPVAITGLVMGEDRLHWSGSFILPSSAGQTPNTADSLTFSFKAKDYLQNPGATILARHQFEVYQGTLPTLNQPQNLTAKTKPGRQVELSWLAIPGAAGYHVYRKLKVEPDTAYVRLTGPNGKANITFTDTAPSDGQYTYAVSTIRKEGRKCNFRKLTGHGYGHGRWHAARCPPEFIAYPGRVWSSGTMGQGSGSFILYPAALQPDNYQG